MAGVRIINPVDKIIRGSHLRKTRFHDEKGNRVDLAGAVLAPLALFFAVLRVTTGYRPQVPTISFRATRAIGSLGRKARARAECHTWAHYGRSLDRLVQRFMAETGACSSRS